MLTLLDNGFHRNCEGQSRREFLQVGTLGMAGLSLPALLAAKAHAASGGVVRDKAVVVLNLQGGPTHIETFDPKMTAPAEYRAMFGEVATSLPGVTFGSHFERLARLADSMAVVRSYRHGISSHAPAAAHVISGGNKTGAMMGSLYARIAGTTNPRNGIPTNAMIIPKAAGEEFKDLGRGADRLNATGTLPKVYAPFDPSAGGEVLQNMQLKLAQERFDDRRALLNGLDQIKREFEQTDALGGADQFQQQAFDVILGGVSEAFDLKKESPATVRRYDTGHLDIPAALYKKKNQNLVGQSPIALGKQMLLARRLVEAGCGFVTVTSAGWDMHGNAFGVNDGMPLLGTAVDIAASAFIEDLAERGLTDKVLLVITGEFGRTPRINSKGGRDHWGNLCTLAFAGGGLKTGQVIGRSDRTASVPDGEPVESSQVLGTLMHTLFDIGEVRVQRGLPNDVLGIVTESQPIAGIL